MTKRTIICCVIIALMLFFEPFYTKANEADRVFRVYTSSHGMIDNSAQTISCTTTGRIILTTLGHVNFFDGVTFTHIDPQPSNVYPLAKYTGYSHVYFDNNQHLWVKDTHRVTCVDLRKEEFIDDVQGVFNSYGIKNKVDDLFADETATVWVVLGDKLVNIHTKCTLKIKRYPLQDISRFENRLFLFYNNGDVDVYDINTKKILYTIHTLTAEAGKRYNATSVLCKTEQGIFQIRTGVNKSILLYLDVKKRSAKTILQTPYSLNSMVVHDNKLYIACVEGYWTYNLATEETKHHAEITLDNGQRMVPDINALTFDKQGGMWLGCKRRGLLYCKPYASPIQQYGTNTDFFKRYESQMAKAIKTNTKNLPPTITCSFVDSRGWTWQGTYSGIRLMRPNAKTIEYGYKDGIANEVIRAVIEDNNHNIWVSTSYGIAHIDVKNNKVKHIEYFAGIDNVPDEAFTEGASLKLADGTIIFKSLDHMVTFHPDKFHTQAIKKIRLTPKMCKILMNGHEVHPGERFNDNVVTDVAISRTRDMYFNYDQNSITLMFVSLNYFRPFQTYYRVRVKGCEPYNEWTVLSTYNGRGLVDKKGALHLPLSGISPGHYEVELQASMSPEYWIEKPYVWHIYVKEPWWRTTIIYVLLGLTLCVLIVGNLMVYNKYIRMRVKWINVEAQVMKRLKTFVQRCKQHENSVLEPLNNNGGADDKGDVGEDMFEQMMLKIMPHLLIDHNEHLSLRRLAEKAEVDEVELSKMVMANSHKNPIHFLISLRLETSKKMLSESTMGIPEIAKMCGFVSANYFIARFYHRYQCTPIAYRTEQRKNVLKTTRLS